MTTKSKSKRGRPKRCSDASSELLVVRLTPQEKQILEDWSWRYETTNSQTVRDCLEILGVLPNLVSG